MRFYSVEKKPHDKICSRDEEMQRLGEEGKKSKFIGFHTKQDNASESSKPRDLSVHLTLTRGLISTLERVFDGLNKSPRQKDNCTTLNSNIMKHVNKIRKNKI